MILVHVASLANSRHNYRLLGGTSRELLISVTMNGSNHRCMSLLFQLCNVVAADVDPSHHDFELDQVNDIEHRLLAINIVSVHMMLVQIVSKYQLLVYRGRPPCIAVS